MLNKKHSDFLSIPAQRNNVTIPNWNKRVQLKLKSALWSITVAGREARILDEQLNDEDKSTLEYKTRSSHLSLCLADLLQNTDDLGGAVDAIESTINLHNSGVLLQAITEHLVPPTPIDAIFALQALASCVQKNGENVDAFEARLDNIWLQLEALGLNTIQDLRLATLQRGILQGVYAKHKSITSVLDKLGIGDLELSEWKTKTEFVAFIKKLFLLKKVIKEGKMTKMQLSGCVRLI